jgi:hypothetical protein
MPDSIRRFLRAAAVCACVAVPWAATAQTAGLPAMKSQDAGRYVCGGVGADESQALRAAMKDHPLSMLFARAGGAYLADVEVRVKDAQGATALAIRTEGPVCLVDLPPGRYTIEAVSDGVAKNQAVTLGDGPRTADFRF